MQPNQTSFEQSLYSELNANFKGRLQPHFQRKSSLIIMSHILEDQVLNRELSPVIFTAFQKAQYFQREKPRYERLGRLARMVTIFGQDLPGGPVFENEWFIVINEPRFKALIASYELSTGDLEKFFPATLPLSGEGNRLFAGFWSYDPEVVDFATRLLARQSDPGGQAVVEQLLSEPLQAGEQFRCVSQVSDLILNHLEKTNLKMLGQIKHNKELLNKVTRQGEQIDLLSRLEKLDDSQKLHRELLALYNETARSHTLLHQTTVQRVQLAQNIAAARKLLPQFRAELDQLIPNGRVSSVLELLDQLRTLLTIPSTPNP